jgi:hypothetical protein
MAHSDCQVDRDRCTLFCMTGVRLSCLTGVRCHRQRNCLVDRDSEGQAGLVTAYIAAHAQTTKQAAEQRLEQTAADRDARKALPHSDRYARGTPCVSACVRVRARVGRTEAREHVPAKDVRCGCLEVRKPVTVLVLAKPVAQQPFPIPRAVRETGLAEPVCADRWDVTMSIQTLDWP